MKNTGILSTPTVFPFSDGRGFGFQTKELNQMARAEYQDTFGFYQNLFGVYSFMQMNKLNKFVIYSPKGHPLMLQPWNSCSVEPTGSLTMGRRELTPVPAQIFEKFCYDELLNSCFEHFLTWVNGEIEMDANGRAMFGQLTDELMANAALAIRASLTSGDFYDPTTVAYAPDTTANLESMFRRVHETWKGWVKIALDASQADAPHLNVQAVNYSTEFDGTGYTGDFEDLYDYLLASAKRPLQQLVNLGGRMVGGRFNFMPMVIVSDSFMNSVIRKYNAQANQTATNRVRITRKEFATANTNFPAFVYYIDQLPIIPLSDIAVFDQYVAANIHFAGIVASGNIQMGGSFGDIPNNIERDDIGMMVDMVLDRTRSDYGNTTFRAQLLGAAAIADTDYMVSTIGTTADN